MFRAKNSKGKQAMTKIFRVIDTGIRPCREQMAFDQALIELHSAGKIPDTLRFLQFPQNLNHPISNR